MASSSTAPSSSAFYRPGIFKASGQSYIQCRETCGWTFKLQWRSVEFWSVTIRCKDRTTVREDSLLQEQTRTWIFKTVQGGLPQQIQTWSTKTQCGRIITAYLMMTFHMLRKSTRICDRNLVASQETKWKTSIWILWYGECLCSTKNQLQRTVKRLFDVTRKLITDQKNKFKVFRLSPTFLAKDNFVMWQTSSVMYCKNRCILRFSIVYGQDEWTSHKRMEGENRMVYGFTPMLRIGSKPMVFKWKIFPGFTTLQILAEIHNMMTEVQCELEQFFGRIIFMSMYQDMYGEKKKTKNCVLRIPHPWQDMQEDSHTDIGRFSGLNQKRNGTELTRTSRTGNGIMLRKIWWLTSVKADIPCSADPVLSNDDLCAAKKVENCLYTSVVIQIQSKWFFARSFPSISSVSTEQLRICVTNWPRGFLIVQKD